MAQASIQETAARLLGNPLARRPFVNARFGAEITGVDPADISAHDRSFIIEAYRESHGLLCFSFEHLLEAVELHNLTSVFGANEFAPGKINGIGKRAAQGEEQKTVAEQVAGIKARGGDPYMAHLGNLNPKTLERKPVDEKFFGEWEWHTDMSYIETPPTSSLLHARVVPEEGGDTEFCSQVMAARELPDALRQRIRGRLLKHDSTYSSNGALRPGMTPPESPAEALGAVHPILRRIPETGEEALYLGRRTNGYIVGLPEDESESLLDELWAHATGERFRYRHHWRVGQVVVWDNRKLMHKRHPVNIKDDRFMWRTQTKGEAVVAGDTSPDGDASTGA